QYFGEQATRPPKAASMCHQNRYLDRSSAILAKSSKSPVFTVAALETRIQGPPSIAASRSSRAPMSMASLSRAIAGICIKLSLPRPNRDMALIEEECGLLPRTLGGGHRSRPCWATYIPYSCPTHCRAVAKQVKLDIMAPETNPPPKVLGSLRRSKNKWMVSTSIWAETSPCPWTAWGFWS